MKAKKVYCNECHWYNHGLNYYDNSDEYCSCTKKIIYRWAPESYLSKKHKVINKIPKVLNKNNNCKQFTQLGKGVSSSVSWTQERP